MYSVIRNTNIEIRKIGFIYTRFSLKTHIILTKRNIHINLNNIFFITLDFNMFRR